MKYYQLFLFAFYTLISSGQNTNMVLTNVEDEIIDYMKQYEAVGLSVAVIKENKIVYSKGFGYRDLEKKLPVTENTLFHIASMTKAFTGSLLGVLESRNQLSLKDRPGLYVPNFQFYNEKMNTLITLEDLLSHKSGLGNHGSSIVMFPETDKLKTVQRLQYLKPQAEIKNSWEYSNIGYTLAGTVVEQITSKSWDTNIQEMLFDPLDMNTSCTTIEDMIKSNNYAQGYAMYEGGIEKVPFENYYSYTPAGAIKSSTKDLSNWMRVWLNDGTFNGTQILPRDYVSKASRPQNLKYEEQYTPDSFLFSEGFGWRIRAWNGHYRLRHGGNTNGFSTVMELFPFEKIGVVVLCNQSNSILPYIISDHISRKLLQLPLEKAYPVLVSDMYKPSKEDKPFNAIKMPTHSLKHYFGTYHAKGYGKIEVIEEAGKLMAVLPTYRFKLEHLHYNSFHFKGMGDFKESFDPEFTVTFDVDTHGDISSLKIHSQKEPIDFHKTRVP